MSPMSAGLTQINVPTGAARPIEGVRTVNQLPPMAHHQTATAQAATTAAASTARAIRERSGVRRRGGLRRRDAVDDRSSCGDPRGSYRRPDGSLMARGLAARHWRYAAMLLDPNPGAHGREVCAGAGRGGQRSPIAHTRPPGSVCSYWSPACGQTCVKVQVMGWLVRMSCRFGLAAVMSNAVVKVQLTNSSGA